MREIRFRAWDGENTQRVASVEWQPFKQITLNDGKVHSFWATKPGKVTLMQFTGLKDKNGVEIYEGDIVQTDGIDGQLLWRIVWSELDVLSGFDYEPIGHSFSCVHNRVDIVGEVIGNIWENPELLENTNA